VIIIFATDHLKSLCEEKRRQQKELGAPGAKKLRARLADLEAATVVTDLVAGRPHPLKGEREGQFAVSLDGGRRVVFEPAVEPPPLDDDGAIAWDRVTSIRVVFIGDYHD